MYKIKLFWAILIFLNIFISIYCQELKNPQQEDFTKIKNMKEILEQENKLLKTEIQQLKNKIEDDKIFRVINETMWEVSSIRGLNYNNKIEYRIISEEEFKTLLEKKLSEQYPDDYVSSEEFVLKLLGAAPEDFKFKEYFISIMLEQAAGVYDEDDGILYVMKKFNLGDNIVKLILSHELTHALQDQNFNISSMPLQSKDNDDLALATLSVLEGDAMIVMNEYMLKNISMKLFYELPKLLMMDQSKLEKAPPILLKILLSPYIQGMLFVQDAEMYGGLERRNQLFGKLPESTEQILHPKKYFDSYDKPTQVNLPDLLPILGEGWKKVYSNVFGEIGIAGLYDTFIEINNEKYSLGWDGDRCAVYNNVKGEYVFIWQTVWDTSVDVDEFYEGINLYFKKRFEPIKEREINIIVKDAKTSFMDNDEKNLIVIWKSKQSVNVVISSSKSVNFDKIFESVNISIPQIIP